MVSTEKGLLGVDTRGRAFLAIYLPDRTSPGGVIWQRLPDPPAEK